MEVILQEKSLGIAYLLWFFFGPLGIHRFYLGKTATGIIWLLTGGLVFIWLGHRSLSYSRHGGNV